MDRPVDRVVEKYIDRPYAVKVPVQVPIPYEVPKVIEKKIPVVVEKHHYQKPDFHVVAKTVPQPSLFEHMLSLLAHQHHQTQVKQVHLTNPFTHITEEIKPHAHITTPCDPPLHVNYGHSQPIQPIYGVPYLGVGSNLDEWKTHNLKSGATTNLNSNSYAGNFYSSNLNSGQNLNYHNNFVGNYGWDQNKLKDSYVGPTPLTHDYWASNQGIKFKRNTESGRSLRIEYGGFHPKMNPSVEIDDKGSPVQKKE